MVKWPKILGVALLSCGMLTVCPSPGLLAATSATIDILSNDTDLPDSVDIGTVKPIATPNREAAKPLPSGNPLWSVPLSALTATQERPIFSASRRPPQRAVVAPPVEQVSVAPPAKAEPDRPALALIGAVVGDSDAIAVFLDRTNQKIVRLRQGEAHDGWRLSSVQSREVTFKKADRSEILVFQRQESPVAVPAFAGAPGLPQPVSGRLDAPFTPRSTPKNGESDGL